MRHLLLFILSIFVSVSTSGMSVTQAEFLAPEDLGIVKYVFEATCENDEVFVLTRERYLDNKLEMAFTTVQRSANGTYSQPILVIDKTFFDTSLKGEYLLRAENNPRTLRNVQLSTRGYSYSKDGHVRCEFVFQSLDGENPEETKFVFTLTVEKYATIKQKFPKLSEIKEGSGWQSIFITYPASE